MNNDRELLELAAKAAGIQFSDPVDSHILGGGVWIVLREGRDAVWNPLSDDGDALRLAVKLGMSIDFADWVQTVFYATGQFVQEEWANADCKYSATRRAIVRAAAEIGKSMP